MMPDIVRWDRPELPEGLAGLIAEAEAQGSAWIATFAEEWRRRPFLDAGEALFVALRDGRPVAMAVVSKDGLIADPDTGRLRYIFVSAAARRQGLAEALVRACLAVADTRWRRLTLHTDNPVAAALYGRYGFVAVEGGGRVTHERVRAG